MTELLLDTHCHLGDYENPLAILGGAETAHVSVVAVTRDPESYRRLRMRLGSRPGVDVALGIHPLHAHTVGANELARFFRLMPRARWIGEIGLDFSAHGAETRRQQLRAFEAILAEHGLRSCVSTVHSRGAESETVRRLVEAKATAILHWYTGPLEIAEEALAGGLWFSVNPAMLASRRAHPLIRLIPRDRVLLETDGPFTRYAGKVAAPATLADVLGRLSSLWQVSERRVKEILLENQRRLLD